MEVVINGIQYVPKHEADLVQSSALDVRFDSDIGENKTVRDYLHELLQTLWRETEDFSGKRPFGNSGWEFELYAPLIKSGHISGRLDEDGYVDKVGNGGHAFVKELIAQVFYGKVDQTNLT